MKITIIVCTRNRAFILLECLESLLNQSVSARLYSILVVDNGSEDETSSLVEELMGQYSNLRYVFEPAVGLSRARNRGWEEAGTPWVGYVDDDSKVPQEYVGRVLWIIANYEFDCFGGIYSAWFKYGKPRWLSADFGTKRLAQEDVGVLEGDYLSGGNMMIKRQVLKRIGGFRPELGMKGGVIGYGEENQLQNELRKLGYSVGFDPELKILHAVLPHKLHLQWHLWSYYASSRDQQKTNPLTFHVIIYLFFRSLVASIILKLPLALFKFLTNRSFYWQNLVLEVFMPIWYRMGQIVGYFGYI